MHTSILHVYIQLVGRTNTIIKAQPWFLIFVRPLIITVFRNNSLALKFNNYADLQILLRSTIQKKFLGFFFINFLLLSRILNLFKFIVCLFTSLFEIGDLSAYKMSKEKTYGHNLFSEFFKLLKDCFVAENERKKNGT